MTTTGHFHALPEAPQPIQSGSVRKLHANAMLDKDTIVISSPKVPDPLHVTLYNNVVMAIAFHTNE